MGMAASQVRFLSLQNRKNTIGLNLMTLSNRKTALSRDMSRVANEYNNAMNQKVLKWSNDSGVTYSDLTYDKLMKPNETNTTKPYIITDAQGRVVLDDNVIELEGKNTGVTYRQLASMISAYSGLTNDKTTYNYTNNGAIVVDKNGSNEITNIQTTAVAGSGLQDGLEYTIPTNVLEYDFQNSLRYDLMKQLDLISESDKSTFDNLIKEQYGSDKFKKGGDYSSILSSFDKSVKLAKEEYGDYSDAFGELQFTNNSFVLNGGSNLGNLALAKAYLAEYKAYLNTDLKRDILVDSKKTVASTTAGASQLDATNTTNPTDFKYDSSMNKGISNRMLGLLSQTGEVTKNGNDYQLNMSGILNHLGFYDGEGNALGNVSDAIGKNILPNNCYHYDEDNIGRFDKRIDNKEVITNWGTLYDFDGGFNDPTNKSYDRNGDGYINGSDYVDNSTGNSTTGVSIRGNSEYDERKWERYRDATGLYTTIDAFANSMLQVEDINADAVKYAKAQTEALYEKEYRMYGVRHNGKGPGGKEASRNHAAGAADSLFGFGYDTIGGHTDPVAFNVTNMINAFITFYEMYVAVDGDTSRIKTGATGAKTYNSDFNALANNYNDNYVQDMKKNVNIMEQAYSSFVNENGATVTNNDSGSHTTGENVTITYTKKSKDPETKEEFTENLTVEGIWGTTGFSSISKLSFISNGKKTEELSYTVDSSNIKTLTQTNYDNNGNEDNTVVYEVKNDGTSNATIDFVTDKNVGESKVKQITIQNGSVIAVNGNSNLNPYQTDERAYYITKKGSTTDEADPEYKYKLVMGDEGVTKSVFAGTITTKPVDKYSSMLESLVSECQAKVDDTAEEIKKIYASFETKGMDYFDALFKMISKNGWVYDPDVNNTNKKDESKNYLNAKLQNNMYFITEVDTLDGKDYNYATKLATNVSKVFQVYDTDAQNQALSKYESEKADINSKEKQIDIRMNKLETEQDAIKTELDSIKSIIKDNVDTTFKIFT